MVLRKKVPIPSTPRSIIFLKSSDNIPHGEQKIPFRFCVSLSSKLDNSSCKLNTKRVIGKLTVTGVKIFIFLILWYELTMILLLKSGSIFFPCGGNDNFDSLGVCALPITGRLLVTGVPIGVFLSMLVIYRVFQTQLRKRK